MQRRLSLPVTRVPRDRLARSVTSVRGGDPEERDHSPGRPRRRLERSPGDLGAGIPGRGSHAASAVAAYLRGPRREVAPEHALLDFVHQRSDRGRGCGE